MFLNIAIGILAGLAVVSIIRIIIGPTVWDRLMCFNLFASKVSIIIVLYAALVQESYLLDFAIAFVLLGFISVIFIANFIQKKGKI